MHVQQQVRTTTRFRPGGLPWCGALGLSMRSSGACKPASDAIRVSGAQVAEPLPNQSDTNLSHHHTRARMGGTGCFCTQPAGRIPGAPCAGVCKQASAPQSGCSLHDPSTDAITCARGELGPVAL